MAVVVFCTAIVFLFVTGLLVSCTGSMFGIDLVGIFTGSVIFFEGESELLSVIKELMLKKRFFDGDSVTLN